MLEKGQILAEKDQEKDKKSHMIDWINLMKEIIIEDIERLIEAILDLDKIEQ